MAKETMTPRQRFLAAINAQAVDRTPVASPTSVATVEQMEQTGARFPAAHVDGVLMAKLAAGAHDILGYDAIMPIFSVIQEAAALGCEIDWGAIDTMPVACTHPWADPEQVTIPSDFLDRPSVKAAVGAVRILRQTHGDARRHPREGHGAVDASVPPARHSGVPSGNATGAGPGAGVLDRLKAVTSALRPGSDRGRRGCPVPGGSRHG